MKSFTIREYKRDDERADPYFKQLANDTHGIDSPDEYCMAFDSDGHDCDTLSLCDDVGFTGCLNRLEDYHGGLLYWDARAPDTIIIVENVAGTKTRAEIEQFINLPKE